MSYIGSASAGGQDSATTSAFDSTGGNFVVITLSRSVGTSPTVSDNKSNTFHPLTVHNPGGASPPEHSIYYAYNATCGTGHTFTVSNTGGFSGISAAVFSNVVSASDPFDNQNGQGILATTSISPLAITPSADGELIICGAGFAAGVSGTPAIDSSFTRAEYLALAGGNNYGVALAYLVQGTAASVNPSWSWSGSTDAVSVIASFATVPAGPASQYAYPISDIDTGSWQAASPGVARNLLTYTEAFDNAAWTKTLCTIGANLDSDPNGTSTADVLIEDGTLGSHDVRRAISEIASLDYTLSIYAKPNGRNFVFLYAEDLASSTSTAYFDISGGSVGTTSGSVTAAITAAANGYYRCSITYNANTGAHAPIILIAAASADGTRIYTGSSSGAINLWGGQFEQASSPSTYQPIIATDPPYTVVSSPIYPALADGSTGTPVDADFAFVLLPGSTYKAKLTPLTDPNSSGNHIFEFRAYSASLRTVQWQVYCPSITTVIKTGTQVLTVGVAGYQITLSAGEADAIPAVDYFNLQAWLTGLI